MPVCLFLAMDKSTQMQLKFSLVLFKIRKSHKCLEHRNLCAFKSANGRADQKSINQLVLSSNVGKQRIIYISQASHRCEHMFTFQGFGRNSQVINSSSFIIPALCPVGGIQARYEVVRFKEKNQAQGSLQTNLNVGKPRFK